MTDTWSRVTCHEGGLVTCHVSPLPVCCTGCSSLSGQSPAISARLLLGSKQTSHVVLATLKPKCSKTFYTKSQKVDYITRKVFICYLSNTESTCVGVCTIRKQIYLQTTGPHTAVLHEASSHLKQATKSTERVR